MKRVLGVLLVVAGCSGGLEPGSTSGTATSGLALTDDATGAAAPSECGREAEGVRACLALRTDPAQCEAYLDALTSCRGGGAQPPDAPDAPAPVECGREAEGVRACLALRNDPAQCQAYLEALASCRSAPRP